MKQMVRIVMPASLSGSGPHARGEGASGGTDKTE